MPADHSDPAPGGQPAVSIALAESRRRFPLRVLAWAAERAAQPGPAAPAPLRWRRALGPALITLAASAGVVAWVLLSHHFDPMALVNIGTLFANHDAQGTLGADGQFVYYMARNLDPRGVAPLLDVPAYRYQRILLPLLAHLLALGHPASLPWLIPAINVLAQSLGTACVALILDQWGASPWYALIYGLYPGFMLSLWYDLPEPLAFGLVAAALLADERQQPLLSWLLFTLALLAKEVTAPFFVAMGLSLLARRRWRHAGGLFLVTGLPFVAWQAWLWATFGRVGLGSGGLNATPFELIPYWGLFRPGGNPEFGRLAAILLFGPPTVLPSLWGIWASIRSITTGDSHPAVWCLLLNALAIAIVPASTLTLTFGVVRALDGLALTALLFVARRYSRLPAPRAGVVPAE